MLVLCRCRKPRDAVTINCSNAHTHIPRVRPSPKTHLSLKETCMRLFVLCINSAAFAAVVTIAAGAQRCELHYGSRKARGDARSLCCGGCAASSSLAMGIGNTHTHTHMPSSVPALRVGACGRGCDACTHTHARVQINKLLAHAATVASIGARWCAHISRMYKYSNWTK